MIIDRVFACFWIGEALRWEDKGVSELSIYMPPPSITNRGQPVIMSKGKSMDCVKMFLTAGHIFSFCLVMIGEQWR